MLLSHQRKELHQQKQNLQNRHYFEFLRYLLVIQVEVGILFLSLYSSDLSPIGKFLVNMKRWIKDKIPIIHNYLILLENSLLHLMLGNLLI